MSYRERQAGMYLVSTCFAAAFLALCVTVTSLAGCSIFPESSGQAQQSQSSLSTAPAADYNPETKQITVNEEDIFPLRFIKDSH